MCGFFVYLSMEYFVYILYSEKLSRYYTGSTSDISIRMGFHDNAEARKFTAKADDWQLAFSLACNNKPQALAIERHIKAMKSKVYIQNLIKHPEIARKLIEKYP